jgi:hypothetical protein
MKEYIVHQNYGHWGKKYLHMVVTPNDERKLYTTEELEYYLKNKKWRYAR